MKTYLVTGAAGFIGANYIKFLLDKKYKNQDIKVVILDALTYAGNLGTIKDDIDNNRCIFIKGDIRDEKLLDKIFSDYDIDYVVNFAAESHVDRSIKEPQLFLDVNILGTQNLLEAAKKSWVIGKDEKGYPTWKTGKRFHQVSTDEVYGSLSSEGYFTEKTPLSPHSPYSASKTSADLFVMAYHDTYHAPISITRCSNNYGPYQFPEKLIPLIINNILSGKSLPVYGNGLNVRDWLYVDDHCKAIDLVITKGREGEIYNVGGHNEMTNILSGKSLPVYGNGLNVRDWLYVDDHCKAIDLVITKGREGEIYNVGGHNEMTNIDIVKLTIKTIHDLMLENKSLRNILKKQEKDAYGNIDISWINDDLITYVADRLGHDARYAIDPTKINKDLGWLPETKFEQGIVKTIKWNLENQQWINEVTSGDYQKYYEQMYGNR